LRGQPVITYGENLFLQFKGDHFTTKEWGDPVLYNFGPTKLFGVEHNAMGNYLRRCYGPSALNYKTRLYPHEVYSTIYASPLKIFSILSQHPTPRYMRHSKPDPLPFDQSVYSAKLALSCMPNTDQYIEPEPIRIWVDGIYDLFHQGHQNINKNAIKFTKMKYPGAKIILLIGVCGDGEDVQAYKRKPIMTLEERCDAIDIFMKELIKEHPDVSYQIIGNSPVTHTLAFIQQHRLNILFHGSDFTPEKIKKYYGVILEQCAGTCSFEILPYTKGVSTTELIGRLLHEGNFGDVPNTTGISTEILAERVRNRAEEFHVPAASLS
jgi:cytidyltransferase-like protein